MRYYENSHRLGLKEICHFLFSFLNIEEHSTDLDPDLSTAYDYLAVSKFDIILMDKY